MLFYTPKICLSYPSYERGTIKCGIFSHDSIITNNIARIVNVLLSSLLVSTKKKIVLHNCRIGCWKTEY